MLYLLPLVLGASPDAVLAAKIVTLILNPPPNGLRASIVYTQRKGFFLYPGLVLGAAGAGHSVRAALKRQEAFAVDELATVIEARTQGLDVYAVASLMERYPGMLIALGGTQRE